jgi:hypothetical protein
VAKLITSQHGPRRKHRPSVTVQFLLSDGVTHFIVAFAVIGTNCAENNIPLFLFAGRCLVKFSCCEPTILALSEYATYGMKVWTELKYVAKERFQSRLIGTR